MELHITNAFSKHGSKTGKKEEKKMKAAADLEVIDLGHLMEDERNQQGGFCRKMVAEFSLHCIVAQYSSRFQIGALACVCLTVVFYKVVECLHFFHV